MSQEEMGNNFTGLEIAVIGMSGRFPGAKDTDELWRNLVAGIEGIAFFSDQELLEAGESEEKVKNPRYVKAFGWMEDIDRFDASFFDYTPLEAEIMDPQVRIFHECVHAALENAGYNPHTYQRPIGVYAGASASFSWQALTEISGKNNILGWFASKSLNDKDALSTRLAFRLNLKGPAVTLDSACSTSLLAVHMAGQGLICGDCDLGLAGGVTVPLLKKLGYLYQEGMINSSDGHCRAFSALANGSNFGNAAAVVVLKRLEDALADNDTIHAVIKGTAINNDGSRKAAFTAPSVEGQATVIRAAHQMAEVSPETIGYIETHGTGTTLGDPVEIEGLRSAFNTSKKQFCAIGSVKTNLGHLEMAAGVTGVIKTVLALKHKLIPPSLFYEKPNPKIDFSGSPFKVNTGPMEWNHENSEHPRRAGVSSFGIGGTNVHVVLEEWPQELEAANKVSLSAKSREYQLILLSARTETGLDQMTKNQAGFFRENPGVNLRDTAYTLQVGRQIHPHRRLLVCKEIPEAIEALTSLDPVSVKTYSSKEDDRPMVFMFPGLGSQYVNMGRGLYENEPLFRQEMDRCFELLNSLVDFDVKGILYPAGDGISSSPADKSDASRSHLVPDIHQPEIAQVVIFIFEYSLAKLLIKWDIVPNTMIGYSFGEYIAACIAGVFSLEDALELVVYRGRLLKKTPAGAMLSVPLSCKETELLLKAGNHKQLSIGIDNGSSCVVSGPETAVDVFEKQVKEKGLISLGVTQFRALHSRVMESIAGEFREKVAGCMLNEPNIPFISNVTGQWITVDEAENPDYWVKHLTQTVQFAGGMKELLKEDNSLLVEIGPGRDLRTLALRYIESEPEHRLLNLIRHPQQKIADDYFLLSRIGRLWLYGCNINWQGIYSGEKRKRIPLPTYPFERRRYWPAKKGTNIIAKIGKSVISSTGKKNIADYFYTPSWKRCPVPVKQNRKKHVNSCWLVFIDDYGFGSQLVKQLEKEVRLVVTVKTGAKFCQDTANTFTINPDEESDFKNLFNELHRRKILPNHLVHLWNITPAPPGHQHETASNKEFLRMFHGTGAIFSKGAPGCAILDLGFYSLLNIARSIGGLGIAWDIQLSVITNNMQEVTGGDGIHPEKTTVIGPVKVIPSEYKNIKCRSLDIVFTPSGSVTKDQQVKMLAQQLLEDIQSGATEQIVAYRGDYRWVQVFEPVRFGDLSKEHVPLRHGGVYVITGGLGGIGLALAGYLAKNFRARLVLTGRREMPPRDQWEEWLSKSTKKEELDTRIQKVKELEELAAEVLVFSADVSNPEQMKGVFDRVEVQFGEINGIIHCAGLPDGEMIQRRSRETSDRILAPKVQGTLVLDGLIDKMKVKPDFFMLCSSTASILPMFGQVGYCSANTFLDAFALLRNRCKKDEKHMLTVSINWDRWRGVGVANILEKQHKKLTGEELEGGITGEEGIEAFRRILADRQPQVVVSNLDISTLLAQFPRGNIFSFMQGLEEKPVPGRMKQRPQLDSVYTAPRNDTEASLAKMWSKFFGYETIGIEDDFFELGGDSLKAITMLNQVHKTFDTLIPLPEFFNTSTVRWLAELINDAEKVTFHAIVPVEKKEYYPLSSSQKRLYILHQFQTDSIAYNESQAVFQEKELDRGAVERTFKTLIRRHESLRASFRMVAGEPVQKIHRDVDFAIEYYEKADDGQWELVITSDDPGKNRPLEPLPGVESIIDEFIRPFDLSHAPLLRVGIINLEAGKHVLIVDLHHIITDGISNQILLEEFKELYRENKQPVMRIQYRDYAGWQNRYRGNAEQIKQEEYWLKQFAGEIPVLNLPADETRPIEQSFAGKIFHFEIGRKETSALIALAAEENVTLYMKLLAIFNIFLFKLTGQEDIVVGSPIAGRRHVDIERVIGMFVNTLVMRNYPNSEKSFVYFLSEVKERTLKAIENQDYQFEDLVEKVVSHRDVSHNPLFDVMLVLRNMQVRPDIMNTIGPGPEVPGFNMKPYRFEPGISRFDLTMYARETQGSINISVEYCTRLFKEETIERMIGYFNKIVLEVTEFPGKKIGDIDLMAEKEKQEILYDFNNTETVYPENKTIHRLFVQQVNRTPDHVALVRTHQSNELYEKKEEIKGAAPLAGFISITYRELHRKSDQLACWLQEKGVETDTIVGIMLERSIEMIIGIFAILKAGGAYLPIDPSYPEDRIKFMLGDSEVKYLVKKSNVSCGLLVGEGVDLISIDGHAVFSTSGEVHHAPTPAPAGSLAYIIFTSGSSGKPKGVMINHASVVNILFALQDNYPFYETDNYLFKTSYVFDVSVVELFGWFLTGGRMTVLEPGGEKDPQHIIDTMKKQGVTHINFVPSMFGLFLEGLNSQIVEQLSLSGLRYIFLAGEALSPLVVNRFKELDSTGRIRLENIYGPTEGTVYAAHYPLSAWNGGDKVPIGKPLANVQLYIMGQSHNHRLQPIGVPGQLCIGGKGVARGYLNNPGLTLERFINYKQHNKKFLRGFGGQFFQKEPPGRRRQKIYKTGDLARWLPGGNIEFLGRMDNQVKIRGFRVELGEIEHHLENHPEIKETVVLIKKGREDEKYLCAYIVPENPGLNPAVLRDYLSKKLPYYMVPGHFVSLDCFPLTPSGKVDRQLLLTYKDAAPGSSVEYVAPGTNMEKIIAEAWKQVLGLDKVGVNDRFFDVGGNSANILQVHHKLKDRVEMNIPIMAMFLNPTIYSLARYLGVEGTEPDSIEIGDNQQFEKDKTMMKQSLQKLGANLNQ